MVSIGLVKFVVSAQRAVARDTLHFDQHAPPRDPDAEMQVPLCEDRLAAVINATDEARRSVGNLAQWGSLGRCRPGADLFCATDDIVYPGIRLMANHCEVLDLGLETQTPFCVVSSQTVEAALTQYDLAGRPTTGFEPPPTPRGLSLLDLRAALAVQDVRDELECVTFVLHFGHHWSLLVYDLQKRTLIYYDSFGDSSRERALVLANLLRSAEIVPIECRAEPISLGVQQNGYWQCGYAAIVFAAFVSEEMEGPEVVRTVTNDAELVCFIKEMRRRSAVNRTAALFIDQNTHWYRAVGTAEAAET